MGFLVPNASGVASPAEARLFQSDLTILEMGNEGYFVRSGLALTAGSGLSVTMAAGTVVNANNEVAVSSSTNFSTGISADATNPKWVLLEVDSAGALQANAGTAQSNPETPTPTTTRTVIGALYIPANATTVEVYSAGGNNASNAQIIDKRVIRSTYTNLIAVDNSATPLTNPTTLTSILAAPITIPASSMVVGDLFEIECSGSMVVGTNGTVELKLVFGAGTIFDYTSSTLGSSVSARSWKFRAIVQVGSGLFRWSADLQISAAGTASALLTPTDNVVASKASVTQTMTNSAAIDLTVKFGTSNGSNIIQVHTFAVKKLPA